MEDENQLRGLRCPVADTSGEIVQTRFFGTLAASSSPDFIIFTEDEQSRFILFDNNFVELRNIYNNLWKVLDPHTPISLCRESNFTIDINRRLSIMQQDESYVHVLLKLTTIRWYIPYWMVIINPITNLPFIMNVLQSLLNIL